MPPGRGTVPPIKISLTEHQSFLRFRVVFKQPNDTGFATAGTGGGRYTETENALDVVSIPGVTPVLDRCNFRAG